MVLLDARRHWFGKGKYSAIGCMVSPTNDATDEDLQTIFKDIQRLKRHRLDFILEQLDRYLLEAQMLVTGHTTNSKFSCETIDIENIQTEVLRRYGSAIKHRAAILGNEMVRKANNMKKSGNKTLWVCHSILKDGTDEYSKDPFFY